MAGNTIEYRIVVKDDGTAVLKKSTDAAAKSVDGLGKSAKTSSVGVGALGAGAKLAGISIASVTAAATATVAALAATVTGATKTGEAYFALSQKTGLSVEALSGYSVAAGQADVSSEALGLGIKNLNVHMVDAASGGKESISTFKALGVEVTNTDGTLRNVNDVFLDTIDGLNEIQNEGERAAAAQAVFGRSSQDLIPLIAEGSGKIREQAELAGRLALVWSQDAAKAADDLGDQVTLLRISVRGVSDEIGAHGIPTLTRWVEGINDVILENRELISQGIDLVFRGIGSAADFVASSMASLARGLHTVGDALDPLLPDLDTLQSLLGMIARLPQFAWITSTTVQVAAFSKANQDAAGTAVALAATLDGYGKAIQGTVEPSQQMLDQAAQTAAELKTLTDKYPAAARAVEGYRDRVKEAGAAAGEADKPNRSFAAGLDKSGSEAEKTAEKLAQLTKSAASSAVALVSTVAAQGDATATQEAYAKAVSAVVDSYNAQVVAIDASTADVKVKEQEKAAAAREASDQIVTAGVAVVKSAEDQAAAIAQLDAAIQQSNLTLLADQIAQVTEDWNLLSTSQRESELPEVLALTEEKYRLLAKAAEDAVVAQKAQGVTAAEAERIDANLVLTKQHLTNELTAEKEGWIEAASGADQYVTTARAVEDELREISASLAGLAASVLTGQADWKDVGQAIGGMFLRGFEDVLASQLEPIISDVLGGLMKSSGLSSIVSGFGGWLGSMLGASTTGEVERAVAGVGTNSGILSAALASGGQVGTAATTGFAATLTAVAPYAAAAVAAGAVLHNVITRSDMGPEAKAAIITALAGPVAGGLLYAFGVLDSPDMRKRIAQHVEKTITTALSQDADFRGALEAGLAPLGYEITPALVETLADASRSNDLLRAQAEMLGDLYGEEFMAGFSPQFIESINKHGASSTSVPASDWILAFFPEMDEATQAYVDQLAKSLASVQVAEMGLTGPDAITYTENIAAGFINYAQSVGMTEEELIAFLEASNRAAGMSTQLFATLDKVNGAMVEQGVSLANVAEQISKVSGVDVAGASNLVDMFLAADISAETFVKQLEKIAQTDPGLQQILASLDPPLIDALHDAEDATMDVAKAFGLLSGTANASLSEVVADFERFAGQITQAGEGAAVELSSMGESLNRQLQQALSGMSQTAIEDGQVTIDEVSAIFVQLGEISKIPADQLSEATRESMQELMDFLMQATNMTADELSAAVAAFNAGAPPPLPPPDPGAADGYARVAESATTAATATTTATVAAEELGPAVSGSVDEFAALATAAGMSSEAVRAAIQPIIGTVGDGASLTDMEDALGVRLPQTTSDLTQEILGATGTWADSFHYSRGAVEMLNTAISEVPTDKTITFHIVTEGTIPTGGTVEVGAPESHGGELIPGVPGSETLRVLEAGELVISAPDTAQLLRGPTPSVTVGGGGGGGGVGDVAGQVVDRLTQGGRLHVLVASDFDYRRLASQVRDGIAADFRAGALVGAKITRNPGWPS